MPKHTPNLKQIEAFRAVMVTGTTLGAGRLLHLSQPAVSRLVGSLEQAAGRKLFERKQGRLRPTQHAEALLEEVEKTFAGLDRVASLLRSDQGAEVSHLRIVATTPLGHGVLPQALARFRAEHPQTTVSLHVVVRRELRAEFDRQQFEVALSTYPLDYPDDASDALADTEAVCVLPRRHRLARREVVTPADLAQEHFIAMPIETGARQKTDVLFSRLGVTRRVMSEAQNGTLICQMVAAGMGVSIVDPFSAHVFARDLVRKPLRPTISHHFRFFYPLQRPRSPLIADFRRIVREAAEAVLREA
jgi:DNA-binding transcriptional LysR family regulator